MPNGVGSIPAILEDLWGIKQCICANPSGACYPYSLTVVLTCMLHLGLGPFRVESLGSLCLLRALEVWQPLHQPSVQSICCLDLLGSAWI